MKNKIRHIVQADVSTVLQVGLTAFDWPCEQVLWNEPVVQWYVDHAAPVSFVAENEGDVVGFALCFVSNDMGCVEWIAVDDKHRLHGIARRLLAIALLTFRSLGIPIVTALVREDGHAEHLFTMLGFQDYGLRKMEMKLTLPMRKNKLAVRKLSVL